MIADERDPAWVRWPVVGLATVSGGWMLADGIRALATGDYVRVEGELGPWADLVERTVGVDAEGTPMKISFVVLGLTQLVAAASYATGRRWVRPAVTVAAIASLWYLVVGTASSLAQLALLAAGRRRRATRR